MDNLDYLNKELSFSSDSISKEELNKNTIQNFNERYSTQKAIDDEIKLIGKHGWDNLVNYINKINCNNTTK